MKAQARKVMIRRSTDLRDRAINSPIVLGIAGAVLGTLASRFIRSMHASRKEHLVEWEPLHERRDGAPTGYDEPHPSKVGELKDKAADMATDLKERAVDMKDRAMDRAAEMKDRAVETVDNLREKLPSTEEIKDRFGAAVRYSTEEQPALGATLALGAGIALGLLLPVSRSEERVLGRARASAAENLGAIEDKVRDIAGRLEDKLDPQRGESAGMPNAPLSTPPYKH